MFFFEPEIWTTMKNEDPMNSDELYQFFWSDKSDIERSSQILSHIFDNGPVDEAAIALGEKVFYVNKSCSFSNMYN